MKIAVVTDHVPYKSAHSIYFMKHAQGFFKLGHDVEIIVLSRIREDLNRLTIKNLYEFYDISKQIKITFIRDYSPYYFLEVKYLGGFLKVLYEKIKSVFPNFFVFIEGEFRISRYCFKMKKDLVYCQRIFGVAYQNIINKIPTIIENHRIYNNIFLFSLKLIFRLSKSRYFKGFTTIHPIIKEQFVIQGVPKFKIFIFEDVVDFEKFKKIDTNKFILRKKLKLPINKKLIMYSGSLIDHRGIDTILLAANQLKDNKDLHFYFIGGNKNDIKRWKQFIKEKNIRANIEFLGYKQNILIPYYLKAADILLAPYSLKCTTINQMSPLKIFEYMASKVPIIASNVKRLKEICKNNSCIYFYADQPEDLSEKINLLLNNIKLQQILIQNAYNLVKNYTYEKRCKKILEYFQFF